MWSPLKYRRPLLPMPEVILLLDASGRIVKHSDKFPGDRLSEFEFAEKLSIHEVFHAGCNGSGCQFADNLAAAWRAHRSGLPVEWYFVSQAKDLALRLRLQPVNYACAILFGDLVDCYNDHSVLFVQDLTASAHQVHDNDAESSYAKRAKIYRLRRSTDSNADIVASMDDRLRSITSQLLVSQEAERKRIASELHDSLGQSLSLLRLEIDACLGKARTNDGAIDIETLERVHEHSRRALRELRDITRNLRPTIIDDVGLEGTLDLLCRDFQATRPEVSLDKDLSGCLTDVPDEVAVAVYRIAQEALNNAARHSEANSVCISFTADENTCQLVVSDDGCGMPSGRMPKRGLGLITMRERAETLGGVFETDCRVGEGCKIRVAWPR